VTATTLVLARVTTSTPSVPPRRCRGAAPTCGNCPAAEGRQLAARVGALYGQLCLLIGEQGVCVCGGGVGGRRL
jgi:hypothetical protein